MPSGCSFCNIQAHLRILDKDLSADAETAIFQVGAGVKIGNRGYAWPVTATDLGIPAVRRSAPADANRPAAARPADPRLIDTFGRVATDLRISLTDRCNLRCTYCMPAEGLEWMPRSDQLSDAELVRLIGIAVHELGIRELRFTGGEPLLRRGLETVIAASAALQPRPDISLTTNAVGLARRADALAAAGVDRLNVSMDTLRPDRFATITRRDRLSDVLDGLAAARAAGLDPIKINTVLLRGVNDDEAVDLLRFAVDNGYELRFIEQMPLDAQHGWQRTEMITAGEIMERLGAAFDLTPDPGERGGAPAERWLVDGGPAVVGVIASVTRPFCGACDRTRLTADGQVRSCLFARTETDLRALLRGGATDAELAEAWRAAMWAKLPGHGIDEPGFLQPDRPMSAIGG
jgi:cyclic pyranopterin phosphate synthase